VRRTSLIFNGACTGRLRRIAVGQFAFSAVLLSLICLLGVLHSNAQGVQLPAQPNTTVPQQAEKAAADAAARRKETFEIVWQTVKDYHFDPTFGGVDWTAVHAEFAPRVERTQSDSELHQLLQAMLNRLGRSHFVIIPPESIPADVPDEPDDADDEAANKTPEQRRKPPTLEGLSVTEQLTNGIGIDLRIINGAAVITRVEPMSPAARAGLRPGFIMRSVDGRLLTTILRQFARASVYQPIVKQQLPTEIIVSYFNGPPGTYARLSYLDALNRLHRVSIRRERLKGEMSPPIQTLPPFFVEFEARRLPRNIGYIRFNLFAVPVMTKFCAALREMSDAPGIIIDLRGNRGGILGVLYGLGGLLEATPVSLGTMHTRAGVLNFQVIPQKHPYTGQLVVLIDNETLSAGEMFASGLRETGRALLVGERSAGATLPSVAKELPTGAILQYAFADFRTPRGNLIEGRGVNPDINVKLNRRMLLAGRDAQLEIAISLIQPQVPTPQFRPDTSTTDATDDERAQNNATTNASVDPQVEPIINAYVQAIGGQAALEKISSRISQGTFNGSFAGMSISTNMQIIEKAPDKSVTLISIPGVGVMRRSFTGTYGYEQIPLFGFRELHGAELADLRVSSDLHWSIDLKRLYPKLTLQGKTQVGDAEAYVVEATPAHGPASLLYFDVRTGLLLRRDDVYFEDYRAVDGLMLPFTIRTGDATIKLTEMRHNVSVDDATFVEQKDCFNH
jgi:carboxyl-terminal processing protease